MSTREMLGELWLCDLRVCVLLLFMISFVLYRDWRTFQLVIETWMICVRNLHQKNDDDIITVVNDFIASMSLISNSIVFSTKCVHLLLDSFCSVNKSQLMWQIYTTANNVNVGCASYQWLRDNLKDTEWVMLRRVLSTDDERWKKSFRMSFSSKWLNQ